MLQFLIWWYSWGYILGWLGSLLPIAVAGRRALPTEAQDQVGSMMMWLTVGCMSLQVPIYLGVIRSYRLQALAWLKLVAGSGGMAQVMRQNSPLFWYALLSAAAIPIGMVGALSYLAWRRSGR